MSQKQSSTEFKLDTLDASIVIKANPTIAHTKLKVPLSQTRLQFQSSHSRDLLPKPPQISQHGDPMVRPSLYQPITVEEKLRLRMRG